MSGKFHIFPWTASFLEPLKDFVDELTDGHAGRALIVTPHQRPARYLTDLYSREKKARILPRMLAVNDLVSIWRAYLGEAPRQQANALDQVALLHECVHELNLNRLLASRLSQEPDDMGSFLPWGLRLARLLEEFALEGREISDFPDLADELGKTPAAILSSLREISELWERKLAERSLSTVGQDHKQVAAHADEIPPILLPTPERPVILAGFYILNGTHEHIFKSLWQNGAHVCLHSDPALLDENAHWACRRHADWMRRWHAKAEVMQISPMAKAERGACSFFAGHDLHSQLGEMRSLLAQTASDGLSTAIIPCREEALAPILQHLPPVNVNVSMGYPMERTPLIRLIQAILRLFASSPGDGLWKSADALAVIRHPYMRILKDGEGENDGHARDPLGRLESDIEKAGLYWRHSGGDSLGSGIFEELSQIFGNIGSLDKLGMAILSFCHWLLARGRDFLEKHYPLDLEIMHRLVNELVPLLRNSLLTHSEFPLDRLSDIFMELVKEEHIPFQADPIEALQVLGLLESRLLYFDRLLFLDATDDVLPGQRAQDPLLPESLRSLVGLPDNRDREAAAAHNLFRLLAGAKECHFLWQEGIPSGEFYDSKKSRSRFVERLIWEAEKERPELLADKGGLIRHPGANLHMPARKKASVKRSRDLEKALDQFWSRPLSITAFDSYLACPLSFIWSKAMNLGLPEAVMGREAQAGTFIHKVLEKVYDCSTGELTLIKLDKAGRDQLVHDCHERTAAEMGLASILSPEDYEALNLSVPGLIKNHLDVQAGAVFPEIIRTAAERDLAGSVAFDGRRIQLRGRIDRLDLRSDGLYVIDYKSGKREPVNNENFWEDNDFFKGVARACSRKDAQELEEHFDKLRKNVQSLQLPLYLVLLTQIGREKYSSFPVNAAWVPLRFGGYEKPLLSQPLSGEDDPRLERFVLCLRLLYTHMRHVAEFEPQDLPACKYCANTGLCGV